MKSAYLLTAALLVGSLSSVMADDDAGDKKKKGMHNPSGTWVWESEVDGAYIESTLKLALRGEKLTGEYSDQNVSLEIENAAFDGKTVTFTLEFDVDGTEVKADFSGVADGDKLVGTTKLNINGAELDMPVDAKRRTGRRDVVGEWQCTVETDIGELFEPTITMSLKRGRLVGTMEEPNAGSHDLSDIVLKDNKLTFKIEGDADAGGAFTAEVTAMPRGDQIRGKATVTIDGAEMVAKIKGNRVVKDGE